MWRYHHFTQVYHKKIIWNKVPEIWSSKDRSFCLFGSFLPYYTSNNLENQNFEDFKKLPGDLHMYTINDNHMIYCSWYMGCMRQDFLSFWIIYCPFTPIRTWKINVFNKWKKMPGYIINSHKCTINGDHMKYGSWDMEHERQIFLVI